MVIYVFDAGVKGWTKIFPLLYLRNRLCWHGPLVAIQIYYKSKVVKLHYRDDLHIVDMLRSLPAPALFVSTDGWLVGALRKEDIPAFHIYPQAIEYRHIRSRTLRRKIYTCKTLEKLLVWTRKIIKKYEIPPTDIDQILAIVENWTRPPVQYINIVPTSTLVYTINVDTMEVQVNTITGITCYEEPRKVVLYRNDKPRPIIQKCRLHIQKTVTSIQALKEALTKLKTLI